VERVLVVDDEVDALEILSWMLTDEGCEVRTASDVDQAVSVGRDFHPTLLITDYLLRDSGTGLDVIRELRHEHPGLPAVLITVSLPTAGNALRSTAGRSSRWSLAARP
jgi:DNA-binding NtrC family response regulator